MQMHTWGLRGAEGGGGGRDRWSGTPWDRVRGCWRLIKSVGRKCGHRTTSVRSPPYRIAPSLKSDTVHLTEMWSLENILKATDRGD